MSGTHSPIPQVKAQAPSGKRALYLRKRAQFSRQKALYSRKIARHSHKRALFSCKRDSLTHPASGGQAPSSKSLHFLKLPGFRGLDCFPFPLLDSGAGPCTYICTYTFKYVHTSFIQPIGTHLITHIICTHHCIHHPHISCADMIDSECESTQNSIKNSELHTSFANIIIIPHIMCTIHYTHHCTHRVRTHR